MTTFQWIGVIFIVVVFFGSMSLGRYLRWLDEKRYRETIHRKRNKD